MKQIKVTLGKRGSDTVQVLSGIVSGEFAYPDYIGISVISDDAVERMRRYCLVRDGFPIPYHEIDTEQITTYVLHQLGVPASIKGYYYLRDAIEMALEDISVIDSITKTLYPVLAKKYHTRGVCIERSMRYAIEQAWARGNPEAIELLFGYTIRDCKGKPTNSEFVALIADLIRQANG